MPTESGYPKIDVPNVDIWGFLFERKDKPFPDDKVIFTDPDSKTSYTYAQVKSTAITFAHGLLSLWDWQKSDVLALFTPNCIDTPAVTWGTLWAGGVVSPANPGYTAEELAFQLKDSGAKALVTQVPLLPVARKAAKIAGIPEERIVLIGNDRGDDLKFKHFTSLRNISGVNRYRRKKAKDPRKDLAFLVYSSGTTGHPKGVMLSHTNIVSNCLMLYSVEGRELTWQNDKVLAFLPFFHIYGLNCLLHQSLYSGVELVVMAKFDLARFCQLVQEYKITFSYVVPPVVLQLAKRKEVDEYDLNSMRMMNSGAAPLTKELVEAVYERLKVPVKQGYGLSETSPTTHAQEWGDWNTCIGSVGKLFPNQTAKYMAESADSPDGMAEVPVGKVGELWIKGPNVFLGYLNNEEGTKKALTEDGYFKTGDVGSQDEKGNFYITDRVKELIKYKGFQVPPAELEGLLASHEDVDDVAVIGIYDKEQATEVPRAYVVLKEGVKGGKETEKRIVGWLGERVAGHKRLRGGVRFVESVPKSVSGKILRRVLKEMAEKEQGGVKAKL